MLNVFNSSVHVQNSSENVIGSMRDACFMRDEICPSLCMWFCFVPKAVDRSIGHLHHQPHCRRRSITTAFARSLIIVLFSIKRFVLILKNCVKSGPLPAQRPRRESVSETVRSSINRNSLRGASWYTTAELRTLLQRENAWEFKIFELERLTFKR